jgi:ribosomal protein S18 acetylase RimI-like enzyme
LATGAERVGDRRGANLSDERSREEQAGASWHFTQDPERYAEAVLPLLTQRPAANTIALTVLDSLRAGTEFGPGRPLLAWYEQAGTVTGAVSMTPPYGLLLTELPPGSEVDLVAGLRRDAIAVPDVNGRQADVDRFLGQWRPASTEVLMRQRLYGLAELRPPATGPLGTARLAGPDDLELVLDWMTAFVDEAEPWSSRPARAVYQRRIGLGLLWLWLDQTGEPVSLAGRNVIIAGMTRVGPVYTPPAARRHGYAAAATHACSLDAQQQGAEQVVLFTNLANPTSNGIYQQLGYQPIEDRIILRFGATAD